MSSHCRNDGLQILVTVETITCLLTVEIAVYKYLFLSRLFSRNSGLQILVSVETIECLLTVEMIVYKYLFLSRLLR